MYTTGCMLTMVLALVFMAPTAAMAQGGSQEARVRQVRQLVSDFSEKAPLQLGDMAVSAVSQAGVSGVLITPQNFEANAALLYLHGGGYVAGGPLTSGLILTELVRRTRVTCFSLDYPLAPEHPYPAAPDNALAAYRKLLDKGYAPSRIVVAGDSAGGGLALALLQRLRRAALPMPAAVYLISPWADLRQSAGSYADKRFVDKWLTAGALRSMAEAYAGSTDVRLPELSPVFADLRGFPPLLIHVGSHEILLDDSLTLARNAALADVTVTLKVWSACGHVFPVMHETLAEGRLALIEAAAFITAALREALPSPAGRL